MSDVNWRPISEWEPKEGVPYFVRGEYTWELLDEPMIGYMLLYGNVRSGFDEEERIEPNENGEYIHANTFGMTRLTHFVCAEDEDDSNRQEP